MYACVPIYNNYTYVVALHNKVAQILHRHSALVILVIT